MKKIVTIVAIVFAAITSYAGNANISKQKDQASFKIINENAKGDCTVTSTQTVNDSDCFGNPLSITYSCTSTASNCTSAYSSAAACAFSGAYQGLLAILEGCW